MITFQPQTISPSEMEVLFKSLAPWLGGGIGGWILSLVYTWYKGRIQKMKCHYVDHDVISRVPVVIEEHAHQNIYTKEFRLENTTNRDQKKFSIIFEFDAQSKILKSDTFSKAGKNVYKVIDSKPNERKFLIKDYNRGDEIKFKFDIANITTDKYNITEADCLGFKIKVIDFIPPMSKPHGKIVRKEDIR
ncbi:MAG: hypothetical protein ACHQQQ_13795 [Bacteroidota bacterium]